MAIHGLPMEVILTTYDTWDDPLTRKSTSWGFFFGYVRGDFLQIAVPSMVFFKWFSLSWGVKGRTLVDPKWRF